MQNTLHFYLKEPTFEIEITEPRYNRYVVKLNGRGPVTDTRHQTEISVKEGTPSQEVKIAALEWALRTMSDDKESIAKIIDRLDTELKFQKGKY